jgi:preprotein translocase subunit SecD
MVIGLTRFNSYLGCLTAIALLTGCQTADSNPKKQAALLRVHLEVNPDGSDRNELVPVTRAKLMVNVEKAPFLTEIDVAEAKVIEVMGGFSLQIRFNRRASLLLEQYSATNPGKRFAIFSQFGEKLREGRWLSAPLIARRVSDGVLTFTPDATRQEAEQIALGLNNVAAKIKSKSLK